MALVVVSSCRTVLQFRRGIALHLYRQLKALKGGRIKKVFHVDCDFYQFVGKCTFISKIFLSFFNNLKSVKTLKSSSYIRVIVYLLVELGSKDSQAQLC
jgi:hypothetical protein